MDEISVAIIGELLCCWRDLENLTLIGDIKQLPATVLTTPAENPFSNIQGLGPFQRWSSLGAPAFLLKEVIRMTAGLEAIANDLFYDAKMVCGPGTELDDPQREMSRRGIYHSRHTESIDGNGRGIWKDFRGEPRSYQVFNLTYYAFYPGSKATLQPVLRNMMGRTMRMRVMMKRGTTMRRIRRMQRREKREPIER